MALINVNFNLEDVKSSFEPLPADKYPVRLMKQELTTASSGNPMIKIEWEVTDGEYTGRKIFDNVVLTVDWKVKQYAELIGVESGNSFDPELFIGVEAIIDMLLKPQTPKEKEAAKMAGRDPEAMVNKINKITKLG